jgi:hypothetical protein
MGLWRRARVPPRIAAPHAAAEPRPHTACSNSLSSPRPTRPPQLAAAVAWARGHGAHVTQSAPGDAAGRSVPPPGAVDLILIDPAERMRGGLEGRNLAVREHLLAGAFFAAQPLAPGSSPGGGGGFLTDCAQAARLSQSALHKRRMVSSGAGAAGRVALRGSRGTLVPRAPAQCTLEEGGRGPSRLPHAHPPRRRPPPSRLPRAGVLLLADFLLLRHTPENKLQELAAALVAAGARHGASPPPPPPEPGAPPPPLEPEAPWALGLRADAIAAAPPALRGLVRARPFRPISPREASRAKPGSDVPEVVRDAVKAWHNAPDLRYAVVVAPDASDVAGAPDVAALVEGTHAAARSQRTVLSGGVTEVTEFLRLLAA